MRLGTKVRALRRKENLRQAQLARMLDISASYLNLIEHDRRPLSAPLLLKLAQIFQIDLKEFATETDAQLVSDLMEVFGDPLFDNHGLTSTEIRELSVSAPAVGKAVLHLYQMYRSAHETAASLAGQMAGDATNPGVDYSRVPSEEVNDFLQSRGNYFAELEEAAEAFYAETDLRPDDMYHRMTRYLQDVHGIQVEYVKAEDDLGAVRRFDVKRKRLVLSESLPRSSRKFQIAHQIALLTQSHLLDRIVEESPLKATESRALCRIALASYYAGAVIMPYGSFIEAVRECRYDVELLGNRFGSSFEQVCHRLTTLRRRGNEGIPFHFVRADIAGNISKRFSASGIQISRFGGACPRWNLHSSFLTPGAITTQLSCTTDGAVYFCIARTVTRGARGYHAPAAVHAVTLGCEVKYAHQMVYADRVDLENIAAAVPIGTTCRLCERADCEQRAFPRIQHPLNIDENVRGISFYAPVRK